MCVWVCVSDREGHKEKGGEGTESWGDEVLAICAVQALLRGPASAYSLVALDVSHCTLIGNGALDLNPRGALRVLRANHCRNIQNVILNSGACPNLEELSLASQSPPTIPNHTGTLYGKNNYVWSESLLHGCFLPTI